MSVWILPTHQLDKRLDRRPRTVDHESLVAFLKRETQFQRERPKRARTLSKAELKELDF